MQAGSDLTVNGSPTAPAVFTSYRDHPGSSPPPRPATGRGHVSRRQLGIHDLRPESAMPEPAARRLSVGATSSAVTVTDFEPHRFGRKRCPVGSDGWARISEQHVWTRAYGILCNDNESPSPVRASPDFLVPGGWTNGCGRRAWELDATPFFTAMSSTMLGGRRERLRSGAIWQPRKLRRPGDGERASHGGFAQRRPVIRRASGPAKRVLCPVSLAGRRVDRGYGRRL